MPETRSDSAEAAASSAIVLEGKASLVAAAALAANAHQALVGSGDVVVRCAMLESIDTRFVQILLALKRELARLGRGFRMVDVPEPVARLLAVTGLSTLAAPAMVDGSSDDAQ